MKNALAQVLLAILALALSACAQTPPASTQGALTISGRSAPSELGLLFTDVRAVRAGTVIAEVPVGLDGSFSLRVPAGHGYRLEFTHVGGASTLIFPRQAGSLEQRFDVLGHGTFDLGTVRRLGDPALHSFRFSSAHAALTSTDSAPAAGDADGAECEDGVDAATGAECDGGYGSLFISANRAVRSFGGAMVLSEVTCLLAAVLAVPALVIWVAEYRARN